MGKRTLNFTINSNNVLEKLSNFSKGSNEIGNNLDKLFGALLLISRKCKVGFKPSTLHMIKIREERENKNAIDILVSQLSERYRYDCTSILGRILMTLENIGVNINICIAGAVVEVKYDLEDKKFSIALQNVPTNDNLFIVDTYGYKAFIYEYSGFERRNTFI